MTLMDISMEYERKFGDITNKLFTLGQEIVKEEDKAREEGRKPDPSMYKRYEELSKLRKKYRKLSDDAFNRHKAKIRPRDLDDEGVQRIYIAVMQRAAMDYENALSKGHTKEIEKIERFGKDSGERAKEILSRIKSDAARFKEKAESEIDAILATTMDINGKHRSRDYYCNKSLNKNRCPLCGGGMYVKKIHKVNDKVQFKVMCTGCNLSAVVEREA